MKNLTFLLLFATCFLACRKQNYASFQPSKFEHFEGSKKNLNKEFFKIANRDSFVNPVFEQKLNVEKENVLAANISHKKKSFRKITIPTLDSTLIKLDTIKVDSLSKETSKNVRIALLSGKTLMLGVVSTVLAAFVWPYFFYLIIPFSLISIVSAFYSVKKVKKPYKFWPKLVIFIYSLLAFLVGLVIFLLRNFDDG